MTLEVKERKEEKVKPYSFHPWGLWEEEGMN